MKKKIVNCIEYVQSFFPNNKITFVIFSKDGQWLFVDENLEIPEFPNELDTNIIEETMDVVYKEVGLPFIYKLKYFY